METILKGTMREAGEAVSGALSSNKKLSDLRKDTTEPDNKTHLTSDFGVKGPTHDIWLSASSGDKQGPQLLEDSFGREKVGFAKSIAWKEVRWEVNQN